MLALFEYWIAIFVKVASHLQVSWKRTNWSAAALDTWAQTRYPLVSKPQLVNININNNNNNWLTETPTFGLLSAKSH